MSLTEADLQRIEQAGRGSEAYCFQDPQGYQRLHNVDGRCFFLDPESSSCTIYPYRPEGCVLYPLIYYTDCRETGLDEFCLHRFEFSFSRGDREWLCRSIAREETEVAARLARQPEPA